MRLLTVLFLAGVVWGQSASAPAAKKKAPAASHSASAKKAAPKQSTASAKPAAAKSAARKSTGKKTVVARRPTQQAPTPDRYKQIQQALADRGYFHGTSDGAWGTDSVDALKRFQKDQNLDPEGKIDSLSLIALGLGPKRTIAASPAAGETPRP